MRGKREGGEEAKGLRRVGGESSAYKSGRRTAERGEERGGRRMGARGQSISATACGEISP